MIGMQVGLTIRAYDRVTGVIRGIGKSFNQLSDAAGKANEKWAKAGNLRNAAEGVGKFGTALRTTLVGTTDKFRSFQSLMLQVKANSDDLTESSFAELTSMAERLGTTTKFSATQAAEAMLALSKAGFSSKQVMQGITPVLNLAAAEAMDLGRAAEIAAGVMTTFGLGADQLGRVGDVLSKTASASTTDVADLGESFKYAGGQAHALNIPLEETAAMFASLAANQIKGSQAGTALAGVLRGLSGASRMSSKVLDYLKVDTKDDNGNLKDRVTIFKDLNEALKKYGTADKEFLLTKLFGAEAVPGALALLEQAAKGTDEGLQKFMQQMTAAAGETQRKADVMAGSSEMVEARWAHSIEGVELTTGRLVSEVLDPLKDALAPVLLSFRDWMRENPGLTKTIIGVVLAGAALATLLSGILFTATTIYATQGLVALLGGFSGIAGLMAGPVKLAITGLLAPLRALTIVLWGSNAGMLAMLGTAAALGGAILGIVLAVKELSKYWKELDFIEGFKGMGQQFVQDSAGGINAIGGAASVVGDLFNPRALLEDIGIMDRPGAGMPSLGGSEAPAAALGGQTGAVDVGGNLRISVDSAGKPRVTSMTANGPMELSLDAGLNMGGT